MLEATSVLNQESPLGLETTTGPLQLNNEVAWKSMREHYQQLLIFARHHWGRITKERLLQDTGSRHPLRADAIYALTVFTR